MTYSRYRSRRRYGRRPGGNFSGGDAGWRKTDVEKLCRTKFRKIKLYIDENSMMNIAKSYRKSFKKKLSFNMKKERIRKTNLQKFLNRLLNTFKKFKKSGKIYKYDGDMKDAMIEKLSKKAKYANAKKRNFYERKMKYLDLEFDLMKRYMFCQKVSKKSIASYNMKILKDELSDPYDTLLAFKVETEMMNMRFRYQLLKYIEFVINDSVNLFNSKYKGSKDADGKAYAENNLTMNFSYKCLDGLIKQYEAFMNKNKIVY